jgi:TP901 family phage tail tape measure protein
MAFKEDKVQTTVLLNSKQAVNELGKLEMEASQTAQAIKKMKKETDEYVKASDSLVKAEKRLKSLGRSLETAEKRALEARVALEGLEQGTKEYTKASDKLDRTNAKVSKIKQEMSGLELETKQASEAMKGMKRYTDEYVRSSKQIDQAKARIAELRKEAGLAGLTFGQLKRYHKELRRDLDRLTFGTEKFKKAEKHYKDVTAEVEKQSGALKKGKSAWENIGAQIKQFGVMALAFLGFQELLAGIGNMTAHLAEMSDRVADVRKTTGLTEAGVNKLSGTLATFNTSKSRKELLQLAQIAGKLGVEGRQNIEGFVKSANMIDVALGEDLGGDAENTIKEVGKLVDIFKVKDEFSLEDGLLKVGSAINSLGASSTASEGYLVDFAKRLGGIAPNANISIANILGLGATLDQLGQTTEVASTSLGELLVGMGQDIPKFAKLAGLSVADFSKLLEEDANEALLQVIENSKSSAKGLAGMAETLDSLGIDGARGAQVMGVLANNIDLVREQQALSNLEFDKGTSIIDEFNMKNTTMAAYLGKIKKAMAAAFTNSGVAKYLEGLVISLGKALTPMDQMRKQTLELKDEMNQEIEVLKRANFSTEQRGKFIKQLNDKYKDYLPRLISEKDSLTDINEIQKELNNNIMSKIILMDYEKEITQIYKDQKNAIEGLVEVEAQKVRNEDFSGKQDLSASQKGLLNNEVDFAEFIFDETLSNTDNRLKQTEEKYNKIAERMGLVFANLKKKMTGGLSTGSGAEEEAGSSNVPSSGGEDAEYNALIEKFKAFNEKIQSLDEEGRLRMADRDVQELAKIDAKYAALLDEAKEFHTQKLINEQEWIAKNLEITKIYEQELEDFNTQRLEKEKQAYQAWQEAQRLSNQTEQEAEINAVITKNDLLIQQSRAFREQGLMQQAEFDALEKETTENKEAALEAIEQKYAQQKIDREREQNIERMNAQTQMFTEFGNMFTAMNQLVSDQGEAGAGFAKTLAIFQIAMDTATALSSAIAGATAAAASTGPGAPFVLAGYIASMVATVFTSMSKAKSLLSAEEPKAPSYFYGGYTGKGFGKPDSSGAKVAGAVHQDEFVISAMKLKNPYVANMAAMIDAMPTSGKSASGYFNGGYTTDTSAPSNPQMQDSKLTMVLIEEVRGLRSDVQNQKTAMRAYFTREDFDDAVEFDDRIKQAEESSVL